MFGTYENGKVTVIVNEENLDLTNVVITTKVGSEVKVIPTDTIDVKQEKPKYTLTFDIPQGKEVNVTVNVTDNVGKEITKSQEYVNINMDTIQINEESIADYFVNEKPMLTTDHIDTTTLPHGITIDDIVVKITDSTGKSIEKKFDTSGNINLATEDKLADGEVSITIIIPFDEQTKGEKNLLRNQL